MRFPFAASCAAAVLAAAASARADTLKVPTAEYPTIQEAVDDAGPGDVVLVMPGTYDQYVFVSGKAGLEIRGKGWPVLAPVGGGNILRITGGSDTVLVTGFEFQGGQVVVDNSTEVSLVNLRFTDCPDNALESAANDGVLISRCRFQGIGGHGVFEAGSVGAVVEKCRFEGIGDFAVFLSDDDVTPTHGAVVSKNRIIGADSGILLGGDDNVIEKNRMEGLTGFGITYPTFYAPGAVITGNRIQTANNYGIYTVNGDGLTVIGNTLEGSGIFIIMDGGTVDRNRVIEAKHRGVHLLGEGIVVTRNQVRGSGSDGFVLQGDGTVVDRNLSSDAGVNGMYLIGQGATVTRNRLTSAVLNGFLVDGGPNQFTGNRASGSGSFDLADTSAEGVNTYEGNHFGTTEFGYVIP
jgi:nitrous oxidase accessory protein NosD